MDMSICNLGSQGSEKAFALQDGYAKARRCESSNRYVTEFHFRIAVPNGFNAGMIVVAEADIGPPEEGEPQRSADI